VLHVVLTTPPRLTYALVLTSASDLPLRTIKCWSVVFGVTLRLLVINTSSSSAVKNKRRRFLATSVNNLPRFVAAEYIALGRRIVHSTRWSQILAENRDFCLPHLHLTPPLEGTSSKYRHKVCCRKTRMV